MKYFADYNRLYGTLGAFIAFLIWLYLFNVALLASTEIDAALEEVRTKAGAEEPPRTRRRILRARVPPSCRAASRGREAPTPTG